MKKLNLKSIFLNLKEQEEKDKDAKKILLDDEDDYPPEEVAPEIVVACDNCSDGCSCGQSCECGPECECCNGAEGEMEECGMGENGDDEKVEQNSTGSAGSIGYMMPLGSKRPEVTDYNQKEFEDMAKMNDTPKNRKGMETLLTKGPNSGSVFAKYKLPWESK